MVQDRKEGAETTKTPVQSVSSVILSTYVLLAFSITKACCEFSPGGCRREVHAPGAQGRKTIPVIQVVPMGLVALVVEVEQRYFRRLVPLAVAVALDQISDYPTGDGIGSSAPGCHQQSR